MPFRGCAPVLLFAVAATIGATGIDRAALAQESSATTFAPAPISQMFLQEKRFTLTLEGVLGSVSSDGDRSVFIYGLGGVGTYAFTDRIFGTAALAAITGKSDGIRATIGQGFVGVGYRILGEPGDRFVLSVVGGPAAVSFGLESDDGFERVVTGAGIQVAVQAEIVTIPYLSIVPYVNAFQLASVSLEENGVEVARADVDATFAVVGFDLWLYLNPNYRGSHIGLGFLGTLGQSQGGFTLSMGYTFSFGGEDAPPGGTKTSTAS